MKKVLNRIGILLVIIVGLFYLSNLLLEHNAENKRLKEREETAGYFSDLYKDSGLENEVIDKKEEDTMPRMKPLLIREVIGNDVIIKDDYYSEISPKLIGEYAYSFHPDYEGLYRQNIYTKEIEKINIPNLTYSWEESLYGREHLATNLIEFNVIGDVIYYFLSDGTSKIGCNNYRGDCSNELFELNLSTGEAILLQEKLGYREIYNFVPNTRRLPLVYNEGDAGCRWTKYVYLELESNQLGEENSLSYCYTGEDTVDDKRSYELINVVDSYRGYSYLKSKLDEDLHLLYYYFELN